MSNKIEVVEVWSDLEAAGGSRLAVVEPDRLLSASLVEDLKGKTQLRIATDRTLEELIAGREVAATQGSLTRTTQGFVYSDLWNRAFNNDITDGGAKTWNNQGRWRVNGDGTVLHQNFALSDQVTTNNPTYPDDCIVHSNIIPGSNGSGDVIVRSNLYGGTFTGYALTYVRWMVPNEWRLRRIDAGVEGAFVNLVDNPITSDRVHSMRIVTEVDGANLEIRGYKAKDIVRWAGSTETLADLTLVGQIIDGTPIASGSPQDYWGISGFRLTAHDVVFCCGRNVVVNGLPTGYKVQLDEKAATLTVESGGTATIDVDDIALPYELLEVYNASDVLVAWDEPPPRGEWRTAQSGPLGGGFGGDIWTFNSEATPASYTRSSERLVLRTILESGLVLEYRIV